MADNEHGISESDLILEIFEAEKGAISTYERSSLYDGSDGVETDEDISQHKKLIMEFGAKYYHYSRLCALHKTYFPNRWVTFDSSSKDAEEWVRGLIDEL